MVGRWLACVALVWTFAAGAHSASSVAPAPLPAPLRSCPGDDARRCHAALGRRVALRLAGGEDEEDHGERILLCTDLDDTLVGDARALAEFNRLWRDTLAPRGCKLVYNTGRSLQDYKALRKDCGGEWELLVPDAFVGGCGTQVYTFDEAGREREVGAWVESLHTGWNKTEVASRIVADAALTAKYGAINEKTESAENPLLYSLRLPPVTAEVDEVKLDMLRALDCAPETVRINVASVSFTGKTTVTGAGNGDVSGADGCLFVDIMPAAAGKGLALTYVRQTLFGMLADECLVAGDSGNDVAMFQGDVERGIMVGNAKQELLAQRRLSDYVATQKYAAGILQGLRHHRVVGE